MTLIIAGWGKSSAFLTTASSKEECLSLKVAVMNDESFLYRYHVRSFGKTWLIEMNINLCLLSGSFYLVHLR